MGIGGISVWQLLIILAIVVLLFGTKKLRGMGADLGGALKGFKKSMSAETDETNKSESQREDDGDADNTASSKTKSVSEEK